MESYLIRAIASEVRVRAVVCVTTKLVREGVRRHGTKRVSTLALGQALTGVALMGALLKVRQRMAIKLQGDGLLQKLLVESDANGNVRGYVSEPDVDVMGQLNKLDLSLGLGEGVVIVVKDLLLKELYEGVVPLVPGDVSDNLTSYLNLSEQIASFVKVDVKLDDTGNVAAAGGILIQALPTYEGDTIAQLQEKAAAMPPIATLIADGQTPETILANLFGEIEHKVLIAKPLTFQCSCSAERSEQALITLGQAEIQSIMETEGEAIIDCPFCHERYIFSYEALETVLDKMEEE